MVASAAKLKHYRHKKVKKLVDEFYLLCLQQNIHKDIYKNTLRRHFLRKTQYNSASNTTDLV